MRDCYRGAVRCVYHRNHVRGIFCNQLKELFALGKLAADSLQLPLLVHGVDVE